MDLEEHSFIAALNLVDKRIRIRGKTSRVLKRKDIEYNPERKVIVGGITTHSMEDKRPAIMIEKENDMISRIVVKCPCGRCSEVICEYDETVDEVIE